MNKVLKVFLYTVFIIVVFFHLIPTIIFGLYIYCHHWNAYLEISGPTGYAFVGIQCALLFDIIFGVVRRYLKVSRVVEVLVLAVCVYYGLIIISPLVPVDGYQAEGKVIVVTGGSTGVGFGAVRSLYERGGDVVIGSRNMEKCEKSKDEILLSKGSSGSVTCMTLDIGDMKSIRNFCDEFISRFQKLDVLVNNAGMLPKSDLNKTVDNIEVGMGIMHFGHAQLTTMLADFMEKTSSDPRVIFLSSHSHFDSDKTDFDDITGPIYPENETIPDLVRVVKSYARSKLANVWYAREFAIHNPSFLSFSVHPGGVYTPIQDDNIDLVFRFWVPEILYQTYYRKWVHLNLEMSWRTVEQGSSDIVYLATAPRSEIEQDNGSYYFSLHKTSIISPLALDGSMSELIWEKTVSILEKYK